MPSISPQHETGEQYRLVQFEISLGSGWSECLTPSSSFPLVALSIVATIYRGRFQAALQTSSFSFARSTVVSHTPYGTSSTFFASPLVGTTAQTNGSLSFYVVAVLTENSDPFLQTVSTLIVHLNLWNEWESSVSMLSRRSSVLFFDSKIDLPYSSVRSGVLSFLFFDSIGLSG